MVCEVSVVTCCQAGIQLGDAVWRSHYAEHVVLADGKNTDRSDDGSFRCFFEETNGDLLVPRNLSFDSEPNVIDDIRNGKKNILRIILEDDITLLVQKLLVTVND